MSNNSNSLVVIKSLLNFGINLKSGNYSLEIPPTYVILTVCNMTLNKKHNHNFYYQFQSCK